MIKRIIPVTSLKSQLMAGIIIGLAVFFILAVFQPFGTFGFTMKNKLLFLAGYGLICMVIYPSYYALTMMFFKKWFTPVKWTIIREITTLLPVIFLISLAGLWYHHRIIGGYTIDASDVFYFFRISLAVAVVPFSVLFYRKYLISNLTTVNAPEADEFYSVTFESNNKNEKPVTVASPGLVYVKSEGNYIEIAIKTTEGIRTHLLRNALNQVESRLPENDFVRIHRSYIVNARLIESLNISGSSYNVKIRDTDLRLPVSRSMIRIVRGIITDHDSSLTLQ